MYNVFLRKKTHFCKGLTGRCTGEVVRIILQEKSELVAKADLEFLQGHDSAVAVHLQKILGIKIGSDNKK